VLPRRFANTFSESGHGMGPTLGQRNTSEYGAAAGRRPASGLLERLRFETGIWHDRVEAVVDVSGSVRSRDSYADFLLRLSVVHESLENLLGARVFEPNWRGSGWTSLHTGARTCWQRT
jgi:heme oxygenase